MMCVSRCVCVQKLCRQWKVKTDPDNIIFGERQVFFFAKDKRQNFGQRQKWQKQFHNPSFSFILLIYFHQKALFFSDFRIHLVEATNNRHESAFLFLSKKAGCFCAQQLPWSSPWFIITSAWMLHPHTQPGLCSVGLSFLLYVVVVSFSADQKGVSLSQQSELKFQKTKRILRRQASWFKEHKDNRRGLW